MPLLAVFFGSLISGLAEFFAKYVTRKVALAASVVAVMVASFAALTGAITAAVAGLSITMPTMMVTAFAFIFPSNLGPVIAACFTIEAVVAGYRWNKETLKTIASIH